ncbi:hypothetical protein HYC85_021475, partial [Camellia sinensis]
KNIQPVIAKELGLGPRYKTISNGEPNPASDLNFDEKLTFSRSNGFTKSISNPEFSKNGTKLSASEAFQQITVPNRWDETNRSTIRLTNRWIYFLGILPYATHSVDFLVSLPFPFLSLPSLTLSSFPKMKMQESRYGEETTPRPPGPQFQID